MCIRERNAKGALQKGGLVCIRERNAKGVLQKGGLGTPVNLLLTSPNVMFPQSAKIKYFCSGPVRVDPWRTKCEACEVY